MVFSEPLQKHLSGQMAGAPTLEECRSCKPSGGIPYHCCRTPGFAVHKNVELIYAQYRKRLWKIVPFGNQSFSFDQFVQFYFTQVVFASNIGGNNVLLELYFPKIVEFTLLVAEATGTVHRVGPRVVPDADLDLIVSFPDQFYGFYAKRNLEKPANQGCVFLERGDDLTIDRSKGCLLHADELATRVTTKPIDCIAFNCKLDQSEREKQKSAAVYFGELFLEFGRLCQ